MKKQKLYKEFTIYQHVYVAYQWAYGYDSYILIRIDSKVNKNGKLYKSKPVIATWNALENKRNGWRFSYDSKMQSDAAAIDRFMDLAKEHAKTANFKHSIEKLERKAAKGV